LFLPAGLVAVVLVGFPIHWIVMIGTSYYGDDGSLGLWNLPPESLERCGQALFAPMALILGACRVAPSHRVHVAGALTVAWAVLIGVVLTIAAQSGNYAGVSAWSEFIAVGVLGAGGTLYSLFNVYQEEQTAST
jgi:hypothetical protein